MVTQDLVWSTLIDITSICFPFVYMHFEFPTQNISVEHTTRDMCMEN
jgi:hypothetical protein